MLWTTEAPERSETITTTQDQANDGVPVGCDPPNFLFVFPRNTVPQEERKMFCVIIYK